MKKIRYIPYGYTSVCWHRIQIKGKDIVMGDCTNCLPHSGYRYCRWYYGHDHVRGCEFGGNKDSGSMD